MDDVRISARKNSAIFIVAYLITSLVNYGFGVVLSWFLNPAQFGMLGVAQSLLLMISLVVGSGFAWTAARDLAVSGADSQTRLRFRAALFANATLGATIALGIWVAYRINWLSLGPTYSVVIPLLGSTTFLLSIRSVINGASRGLYQFKLVAFNLIGEVVIKACLGILLVSLGLGVVGVMVAFALGAFVSLLHSLWIIRPARLWQGKGWFYPPIIAETGPLFMAMLGPALMLNLDVLGLKLLSPIEVGDTLAGHYQAAVILARGPVFVAQAITLVIFSYAASASKGNAHPDQRQSFSYLRTAIQAWFFLLLPISLILIIFPRQILSIFFPPNYQSASLALQIGASGGAMLALVTLLIGVLQARGEKRYTVVSALAAILVQVIVLVWLVPQRGAVGAATSMLSAGITAFLMLILAFTGKDSKRWLVLKPIHQILDQ
jgi:O-antigen/teichoic acid export membrane protein